MAFLSEAVTRIVAANPDKDRGWGWDQLNFAIGHRREYKTLDDLTEELVRKILKDQFGIDD